MAETRSNTPASAVESYSIPTSVAHRENQHPFPQRIVDTTARFYPVQTDRIFKKQRIARPGRLARSVRGFELHFPVENEYPHAKRRWMQVQRSSLPTCWPTGEPFAVVRYLAIVHHSHGDTECACLLSDIHLASANIVDYATFCYATLKRG
jgi:hypothetical protein